LKVSKNFHLWEFMPKGIYQKYGDKCTWFISKKIVQIAQSIRDHYKLPMTINNWANGGEFQYRGFRPANCSVGASLSAHKRGMAIDFTVGDIDPMIIQEDAIACRENPRSWHPAWTKMITRIEEGTPTWTHVDISWTKSKDLYVIKV